MLNVITKRHLVQSVELLKQDRARLDGLIDLLERAIDTESDDSRPRRALDLTLADRALRGGGTRTVGRRTRTTDAVATVLRQAGRPLGAAEVVSVLQTGGTPAPYERVYSVLRKSPLFARTGSKWTLRVPAEASTSSAGAAADA